MIRRIASVSMLVGTLFCGSCSVPDKAPPPETPKVAPSPDKEGQKTSGEIGAKDSFPSEPSEPEGS